jgi:hypothetical protein
LCHDLLRLSLCSGDLFSDRLFIPYRSRGRGVFVKLRVLCAPLSTTQQGDRKKQKKQKEQKEQKEREKQEKQEKQEYPETGQDNRDNGAGVLAYCQHHNRKTGEQGDRKKQKKQENKIIRKTGKNRITG